MRLETVLEQLGGPSYGVTSVMATLLGGGDAGSISTQETPSTLQKAERQLERATQAQANAQSDAAYWGYAGQVAYWDCIVNVLKAAEITGNDNLPDLPLPSRNGVVMDVQHKMREYGKQVLEAARQVPE